MLTGGIPEEELMRVKDSQGREMIFRRPEAEIRPELRDLMLKYPTAGITMTDSVDEAFGKAMIVASEEEKLRLARLRELAEPTAPGAPTPTQIIKATLDEKMGEFLNTKRGDDNMVSGESYLEAQRQYIAGGGSLTNFRASFPPEIWMRELERERFPEQFARWRPSVVTEGGVFSEAEELLLEEY